jgi:hypothetical protein
MVRRVGRSGELETIYSGLSFPTAMTFGPDGALYVSNLGFAGREPERSCGSPFRSERRGIESSSTVHETKRIGAEDIREEDE